MTFEEIGDCLDLLAAQAAQEIEQCKRIIASAERRREEVERLRHETASAYASAQMAARADVTASAEKALAEISKPVRARIERARPIPPASTGQNTDITGFLARIHEGVA